MIASWMPDKALFCDLLQQTVLDNPTIPHEPTVKQAEFLACMERECFFGGAAGGGKSDALLMAALQWIDHPSYAAILFRRTYADLALPGALMDRAHEWLAGSDAKWEQTTKTWRFSSGATLSFGYLDTEIHKYRYQGAEFSFIGFDELTQFTESQYLYLFSRLRRRGAEKIPLRMRAASNPGGVGHDWVKKRFVQPGAGRIFIPSKLADNPYLAREEYEQSLMQLDPITRAQLLAGDWDAFEGGRFKRGWFKTFRLAQGEHGPTYFTQGGEPRGWQLANCWNFTICDPACTPEETTKGIGAGSDPDYTVIGTFAVTPARELLVLDIVRERLAIDRIIPRICEVNAAYQPTWIGIEAVSAFIGLVLDARKRQGLPPVNALTPGVSAYPNRSRKLERATPAIIAAEAGTIYVPEQALWLEDFLAELVQFTGDPKLDAHDDVVDVLGYAVAEYSKIAGMQPDVVQVQGNDAGRHETLHDRERYGGYDSAAERRGLFGYGR